jgi:hypothetical protein
MFLIFWLPCICQLKRDIETPVGSNPEREVKLLDRKNGAGVAGSRWLLYLDLIEATVCYHNKITDMKYFEFQLDNKKYLEIAQDNYCDEKVYLGHIEVF